MPKYLLDTSVYSQPLRRKPVLRALERWRDAGDAACRASVVSVAEVEFGLNLEENPARQEKYEGLLEGRLEVLEVDAAVWAAGGGILAHVGVAGAAMHAAWQLARFDAANSARCLEIFRSNRIFGLIITLGLLLDSLLT